MCKIITCCLATHKEHCNDPKIPKRSIGTADYYVSQNGFKTTMVTTLFSVRRTNLISGIRRAVVPVTAPCWVGVTPEGMMVVMMMVMVVVMMV